MIFYGFYFHHLYHIQHRSLGSQLAIFQGLFLLIVLIALINDDVDVDVLRLIRRCSCRAAAVEEIAEPGGNLKKLVAFCLFLLFCLFFSSYFSHLEANCEGSWQPQTSPKTRPMIRMAVLIPLNEGTVMQRLSPLRHILFSVPLDSADWVFSASIRLFFSSAKRTSSEFFTSRISWS